MRQSDSYPPAAGGTRSASPLKVRVTLSPRFIPTVLTLTRICFAFGTGVGKSVSSVNAGFEVGFPLLRHTQAFMMSF